MSTIMEKLKSLEKYDIIIYILAFSIMIVCAINKEHFTSIIFYGMTILSIGMYGVNKIKSMSFWLSAELSYFIYAMVEGMELSEIITNTNGGVVVALVALFFATRYNKENNDRLVGLKPVFNIIILSTFITGTMVYGKMLSNYNNGLVIAIWILTPTYLVISKLLYTNLTYVFYIIYYIAMGITTYQSIIVGGSKITIVEYLLVIMSLIMSITHYILKEKQLQSTQVTSK